MQGSIYKQINSALRDAGFLRVLKLKEADQLIERMRIRHFRRGETVIQQGDKGQTFYIIAEGAVDVQVRRLLKTSKVAELGPGEFFGEMSLLSDKGRTATVIAKKTTLMFIIYKKDFQDILMKNPEAATLLREAASKRKKT